MKPTGIFALALAVALQVSCQNDPAGSGARKAQGLSAGVRLPGVGDLLTPTGAITASFVERFEVSAGAAERWAREYTRVKGPYARPLKTCLRIPLQDVAGTRTAWVFIFSAGPACGAWTDVLDAARQVWRRGDVTARSQVSSPRLARALADSAADYFTVAVSGHTYRHPLHEAQRGLPAWVFDAALEPDALARSCRPGAMLSPEIDARHFEIVRYDCGTRQILFSHTGTRVLDASRLSTHPHRAVESFLRLRRVLRKKHGDRDLDGVMTRKNRLWTRYLGEVPR